MATWITCADFPDYEISDDAVVRRRVTRNYIPAGRVIRQWKDKNGYLRVALKYAPGKQKKVPVHTLVCVAFHGPRPDGQQVAHSDGNKENNAPSNLRWATAKENMGDTLAHGSRVWGSRHYRAKLSDADVATILHLRSSGVTIRELAARFGVHKTTISGICLKIIRRHRDGCRVSTGIPQGSRNPISKLSEKDINPIRQLLLAGVARKEIGSRFGVSHGAIDAIASGRTWRHVPHA